MADASVRPARPDDAPAVAGVQLRTWRAAYADVMPTEMLQSVDESDIAPRWYEAAANPPSPRHTVLVACEGEEVVGFAALAPAQDEDSDPATDAELVTLLVDPDHGRVGHGSRLLAAGVEWLREHGFTRAQTWLLAGDDALRSFLASAGWAPDGSTRDLEMGRVVHQLRLHTDLTEEPS